MSPSRQESSALSWSEVTIARVSSRRRWTWAVASSEPNETEVVSVEPCADSSSLESEATTSLSLKRQSTFSARPLSRGPRSSSVFDVVRVLLD